VILLLATAIHERQAVEARNKKSKP